MKSLKLFLAFLFTSTSMSFAQSGFAKFVSKTELEFSDGICLPLDDFHGGSFKLRYATGLNARYHFGDSPWKIGAYIQFDNACRKYRWDDGAHLQKNETCAAGVTAEYDFRVYKTVNPFIGIGVGGGAQEATGKVVYPHDGGAVSVIPRIGVEFWNSIRMNVYTQFSRKGYNTVGLTVGFVLGNKSQL